MGLSERAGSTAAICILEPMSIAAAAALIVVSFAEPGEPILRMVSSYLLAELEGLGHACRHLPNRDRRERRHHSQVRKDPWTTFFNGDCASNKLTAATLRGR